MVLNIGFWAFGQKILERDIFLVVLAPCCAWIIDEGILNTTPKLMFIQRKKTERKKNEDDKYKRKSILPQ